MKRVLFILILLTCLSLIITFSLFSETKIIGTVVKVYTEYSKHNYQSPWKMGGRYSRSGSGCIISGNRILTNAHVVGDSTFIQVKRAGMAKKYAAEVEIVAHECDLAILKVKDESFFFGAEPIEIGSLAEVGDKVVTYGFPKGGDELAFTEGVVSRVEHLVYAHSFAELLSCQIDAAINPGSSGGPVIKKNKIVGVAFEAGKGENVGYMVPVTVINHFLKDIEDGKYDGIPGLGVSVQKMENPAMRLKYSMSENHSGVLLKRIFPDSPAKGILKAGDVILSVEGKNIANDGTIEFRKNERTSFKYIIQNKFIDDTVEFEILRDGKYMNVKIKLSIPINYCRLVPSFQYDVAPTYYIVGGLVFEPLTFNYLFLWGASDAPCYLKNHFIYGEQTETRRELVVLVSILADEINVGYEDLVYNVISYVNGEKISTLKDLVKAVENNEGKYNVFVDEWGNKIILDKDEAAERNELILKRYQIPSGRSEDLRK
jgi:S1-C subfamily serine protease